MKLFFPLPVRDGVADPWCVYFELVLVVGMVMEANL
jgi:hypothetical protein